MQRLTRYAQHPFAFCLLYVRRRAFSHVFILAAVLGAVGCSVSTQYGVKFLVDTLSRGASGDNRVWLAFGVLISLIAGDNLLWRVAGWIANYTFVAVTGDIRSDLFRYLTGHAPSYFADRLPGMLSSRITATSNAVFTMENMLSWNVLPPCVATIGAIMYLLTVSVPVTLVAMGAALALSFVIFRMAKAGNPLHHRFADKAAAVDGEMVDIISNMSIVRAFGGLHREYNRFDETIGREMTARRHSLFYLEKLRLFHAVVTIILTLGLLAWVIALWERGQATTGDVVLVCTLGFTILHASRDLAVALVDVTQHMARFSEAIDTLLAPHEIHDHPAASELAPRRGHVRFESVDFAYPKGRRVFGKFDIDLGAGQRIGLVGESGSGKSTLFALLQRFYDIQGGRILIDGADISLITQESLREAITIVPQDISLFHRSVMENIRYGRPDATDDEVYQAATAAQCLDFILALPEGFATVVGDRGVKLSGGQRQRIAIARALLKDAPILLLDEATSSLDSESEEEIRQALDRLMQGRTVIAIAHRLSTLRGFDRIVVLRTGRVIQDGPPSLLMQQKGPYRDLIQRERSRLLQSAESEQEVRAASAG
ncbi:ABC transporter ATP-binding protein [Dongia soli]|uniref:ABC transporter ATP-binding protein n=1 Tax=Dongia soli TaxID=600628 RepID=A0ABU5EEK4_9PROT|nr:ABC transporter ATP-binding protein [Dongia soli]MDY0884520.1 ABC transporter ATP-binding protein [Dongia soli]